MGRLFTTRRSEWLPGVALLGATAGIAAALGLSLGARHWLAYVGLFLALLLVYGWAESRLARGRTKRPAPRSNPKLKLIQGGKPEYDLDDEATTQNQKYLM